MIQLYKYSFLTLIRDKTQAFWSLLFPLMLGTFFYFTFSNITASDNFTQIPVAVVMETNSSELGAYFNEMISQLAEGDNALIKPRYLSLSEAEEQLAAEKIDGIFQLNDELSFIVSSEGVNQSILQTISSRFLQTSSTISNIGAVSPELIEQAISDIYSDLQLNNEITLGTGETDYMVYMFFVLLAMTCFGGCHNGLQKAIDIQANISPLAARRSIAPTKKIALVISDFLAGVTAQFLLTMVSMIYFIFILHVNFGEQLGMVILTCLIGCIVGVSFGTCFGSVVKVNVNIRYGLLTAVSMILYFLSGLMVINIRMATREFAPIIDKINPVTLLSDAFYALTVFDNYDRYFSIIARLLLFTLLFCVVSAAALRRKRYASI